MLGSASLTVVPGTGRHPPVGGGYMRLMGLKNIDVGSEIRLGKSSIFSGFHFETY
jgi:hypothetical protein